ncbi:ABC transporter ATP-binding protein [Amycolatopsis rubida]|uniref:ABC transporter ATP-binding protein n=1 Tax=Amycolatopsis rubida TaxID=112413 RepID=A0A1I5EZ78_9PSEU|nr:MULTISPECIES: ABC transporter ATP-binding protein [Amycolatopsis]MYW94476.1 ATP-binding cassette domain-containing protein [Amycolatopsis rubida]NEC59464.1 ABC transporter ATP-binding protein [Amycolatopsis rubida]OAP27186.1 Oligopeptide transport ATP-binding protein OppD [Amycolatopsis sp. M39]SFO16361.1 ABC-type dipeptide/oligopeptide/nickel transport system, ATPase component [Amycolatopsis rubida]
MTLTVENLQVADLVRGVSFELGAGERVGLIGESGSGKSLTALSVLGLLPEGLSATGSVRLDDRELLGASEKELSRLRGNGMAMVFQEPMTALNPAMRIGRQVTEPFRVHRRRGRPAGELLAAVGLPDVARAYPHQLSGGQRQRVVLAIALANDPALLICDEPTTALDVTVQAQILSLIKERLSAESSLLFITHDLAVVAQMCDRVLVMLDGSIVEHGSTREVLTAPKHAYTQRLLAASDLEGAR